MRKVAVVAASFRMPGTAPGRFWDDLMAGRDLVTQVDPGRFAADVYLHPNKSHPGSAYTFAAGSIGDVSGFDAGFFSISPREASLMDPQQRLLLEMSWETLENAGVIPTTLRGSDCGVYIGLSTVDYSWRLAEDLAVVDAAFATGNTSSIAANRISYFYDLRGPSMAIDTACSSSLVAFHQACRAIIAGEVRQALTGAVSLHLHPLGFVSFSKATMLSRQGRCRVFDASADGYVRSEGGGMFLLKDFDQALADGNPIMAVVAHSAVNTDGHKSGLTVPSSASQASLLVNAYSQAGIEPWEIDYIEAHGTGTPVGDPIETRALGEALGRHRSKSEPLPIGSVKGNVGHLEAASGIAGLVKALYSLRHRVVPAHIGMETPNPHIPFDELNLEVVTANRPLRPTGRLVVGVNSFGFGGANAHVILESYEADPGPTPVLAKANPLPLVVSARDAAALKAAARDMAALLVGQPRNALYDIAYQSVFGRKRHPHCAVLFGTSAESMAAALESFAQGASEQTGVECGTSLAAPVGAAFIYSGNGSQWAGMGGRLLADPIFRSAVREVDRLFSRYADYSLEEELAAQNDEGRYEFTEIAQPALFALQVGITTMLRRRGLVPMAVAGHSVGEVAAAWASGALTLAQAVSVIHHRSALQGTTKGRSGMMVVSLGESRMREMFEELNLDALCVAGINSSKGVTLAGPTADLERLESALKAAGVVHKRLDLDYAFHSSAMDGLCSELRLALAHLNPEKAQIPFYSTVTGDELDGTSLDALYWWRNVREPVMFASAIGAMAARGINIYLEIGPHGVLRRYIQDCLADAEVTGRVLATGARGDDAPQRIYAGLNQALIAGAAMQWQSVLPWRGRHIQLPNYPWQRDVHWHEVSSTSMGLLGRKSEHPLLGYRSSQSELTWENTLDTLRWPMLADHAVGGATVFPGAGYAELALAAAACWEPRAVTEIEDLEILAPLLLADEPSRTLCCALDRRDGQFSVKSREQLSTDAFTPHVVARLLREPTEIRLQRSLGVLPARAPDFDAAAHAALTRAAGLEYGAAFQAVTEGWIDGTAALAILEIPEPLRADLDQYHLHPALLDVAFQLIIHLLRDGAAGSNDETFVPTRIGHLSYQSGRSKPRYARARLLSRGPHSVSAEFELYDDAEQPIALLESVRFRAVRLQRSAADPFRYFEYVAVPRPFPAPVLEGGDAAFPRAGDALRACLADVAVRRGQELYAGEIEPLLDTLCNRFVIEAVTEAQAPVAEAAHYRDHLLALARADGLLDAPLEIPGSAQDIWNSLLNDYPDYFEIVHAVGSVGLHLPALLDGRLALTESHAGRASLPTLLRRAQGTEFKSRIDAVVREQLGAALRALPPGRRLGVVEISAGAPAFGAEICRMLDFDRCDYRFASTEPSSLEEAARLKESYPAISVDSLDADVAKGTQVERAAGIHHLALLTLDFRSIGEALRALEYAHAELAPGALLLVIGQHPARWLDFVFGRDPSWWDGSQDGGPMPRQQPAAFWQQHAARAGFESVEFVQHEQDIAAGPYFLLGRRDSAQPALGCEPQSTGRWLLIADAAGYSAQLATHLRAHLERRGETVSCLVPGDTVHVGHFLETSAGLGGSPTHVVELCGLRRIGVGALAEPLLDAQLARCARAAALIKDFEVRHARALCCFVTADTATHLLPSRSTTLDTRRSTLADAPLAGLVRTMMNEVASCAVRLIDVETSASVEATAATLARELGFGDAEQEIILTASGERYAPRLRAAPEPRPLEAPGSAAASAETLTTRLGFSSPGQLRNLQWERHPRVAPAGDQVEVSVRATGLNFRDVMYTLGLLSDEAVENGFAGSSLGLEFSGVVSSVGPRAVGFKPGDAVVGFAPSSFGDRALTRAGALAHIPSGMSFAAAATIPSTFFTSYYALHHLGRLQEGERVLIHGAAGGVGIAAIQIAKWCGAEIYATAGSDEKRDFLRLLGVPHIFDSRHLDFADQILELTGGEGVDVVLNSLAGEAINRNLRVLKPFGRFLELGKRDFYENTRVGLRPFRNNLSYFGIDADQLMSERPDLTQRLFKEILALFESRVLHPLPFCTFDAAEVVDAFRHMQQSRHIGKIVVTYENGIESIRTPAPTPARRLELSPDATFLVTGGLGGFGLRTAEWLAERGARHLVLISRRGAASEEARAALARLESHGVQVLARACDVTERPALAAVLAQASRDMPPLKGIVHAAMVIEDGLIRDLDSERLRRVLAPKVLGAQHLHELTRHLPLDFFVLYSSATTLFGNPGQGSYVAANCALEALARERLAQGLPATCVRWGAIDDVGFLARNQKIKDALQSRMGGSALQSSVALDALEAMLLAGSRDLGVLDLDWSVLGRCLPSAASPKFAELARVGGAGDSAEEGALDLRRLVHELPEEELQNTVIDLLKVEIAEILRMSPDKIDATLTMQQMGLDSLMGVELVVAVESRFGARLPVMALSDGPTVAKLAAWIIGQLRGDEAAAGSAPCEIRNQIEKVVEQHAADLPAEDIEQMAGQLRANRAQRSQRMIL